MSDDAALATDLLLRLGHLPSCGEGAEFPWDCTCDWKGAYERLKARLVHADAVPVDADLAADGVRWRAAEAEGHVVDFTETGYGLQHPPSCRANLIGCKYNLWLAEDDEPAMPPGRYRMTLARHKAHEEAEYAALGLAPSES